MGNITKKVVNKIKVLSTEKSANFPIISISKFDNYFKY